MGFKTFKGGIFLNNAKDLTKDDKIEAILPKDNLIFPMLMHKGEPVIPVVEVGQHVLRGQLIGRAKEKENSKGEANIHSSVSGEVTAIKEYKMINGELVLAVYIKNDHQYKEIEYDVISKDRVLSKDEILNRIHAAGVVGMSGSGTPTFEKMTREATDKIEYVIVNGLECEPYLTCDHRILMEEKNKIEYGLQLLLHVFDHATGIIAFSAENTECAQKYMSENPSGNRIQQDSQSNTTLHTTQGDELSSKAEQENSESDTTLHTTQDDELSSKDEQENSESDTATALHTTQDDELSSKAMQEGYEIDKNVQVEKKIRIEILESKYPQGSERHLISTLIGRKFTSSQFGTDVATVLINAQTLKAIYEAVILGKPVMNRVVTISGNAKMNPQNYSVYIGTLFSDLPLDIEDKNGCIKIIGGPMMGVCVESLDVPITKVTSGATFLKRTKNEKKTDCIRCARCVDVCPQALVPMKLWDYAKKEKKEAFLKWNGLECIQCGSCSYICPSKIDLTYEITQMKNILIEEEQAKKQKEEEQKKLFQEEVNEIPEIIKKVEVK